MSERFVIEPQKGWLKINFKELFDYRELIVFLAWRNIMGQYKQTFFGVAWAVVKPFVSIIVYTLVFAGVAKLSWLGGEFLL